MKFTMQTIKNYIITAGEFSIPQLQSDLSLTYADASSAIKKLVSEKLIVYCGGLTYKYCGKEQSTAKKAEPAPEPPHRDYISIANKITAEPAKLAVDADITAFERLCINVLKFCVNKKDFDFGDIKSNFNYDIGTLMRAKEWMRTNCYICTDPQMNGYHTLIDEAKFKELFGNVADDIGDFGQSARRGSKLSDTVEAIKRAAEQTEPSAAEPVTLENIESILSELDMTYIPTDGKIYAENKGQSYSDGTHPRFEVIFIDGKCYLSDCGKIYAHLSLQWFNPVKLRMMFRRAAQTHLLKFSTGNTLLLEVPDKAHFKSKFFYLFWAIKEYIR